MVLVPRIVPPQEIPSLPIFKLSDLQKFVPAENRFDIVTTCVDAPSLFYGQYADTDIIQATTKLSQDIAELVEEPPVGFKPNIGEVYAGLHEEYAEWYRVLSLYSTRNR